MIRGKFVFWRQIQYSGFTCQDQNLIFYRNFLLNFTPNIYFTILPPSFSFLKYFYYYATNISFFVANGFTILGFTVFLDFLTLSSSAGQLQNNSHSLLVTPSVK